VRPVRALGVAGSPGAAQEPAAAGTTAVDHGAVRLLWADRPAEALALLERSPERRGDLAVDGAVLATSGRREQGFALLYQEWSRRPGDAQVTFLIALAHLLLRE